MPLRTVTFRVPEERLQALDTLAGVRQRDRSFVLNEAVSQYLSLYDYHCELIQEGIRQDDAGETVSHEEVVRSVQERDPTAAKRPDELLPRAIQQLGSFPELGRVGRLPGTRELVVPATPYVAAYRLRGGTLRVLAILHAAQRWPTRI